MATFKKTPEERQERAFLRNVMNDKMKLEFVPHKMEIQTVRNQPGRGITSKHHVFLFVREADYTGLLEDWLTCSFEVVALCIEEDIECGLYIMKDELED